MRLKNCPPPKRFAEKIKSPDIVVEEVIIKRPEPIVVEQVETNRRKRRKE